MPDLVLDTSAVLAVLLGEPARPALIAAAEGHGLVGAPSLPWEVGNALIAGVRRRRLTASAARRTWRTYRTVPVRLTEIDVEHALETAILAGLYAYDAYVLETARAERLPLLTLDRKLARVAQRLGVRVVDVADESL